MKLLVWKIQSLKDYIQEENERLCDKCQQLENRVTLIELQIEQARYLQSLIWIPWMPQMSGS